MLTLYLIWTLVGGAVHSADTFTKLEECTSALEQWQSNLVTLAKQREEFRDVQLVGCQSVEVAPPAAPEPRREAA